VPPVLRSFLILLALALLTRLSGFVVPFLYTGDEGTYSALAVRILHGAIPFQGAVDHKPPGMSLLYAAVYALVGANRILAVRVVLVLAVATTGTLLSATAERLTGDARTRVAGALYVVASACGLPSDAQSANSELFLDLPLAAAALLASRFERAPLGRAVAAGALTGVAALFKYQAGLAGIAWLAVALGLATTRDRLRALAGLAAGFVAVAAAYPFFFQAAGAWDDFVQWGWRYNFRYLSTLTAGETARMAAQHTALVAASWSWLLGALVLGRRHIVRDRLILVWLVAMLVAVVPGGRFFPNYFLMVLPPLALLVASALAPLTAARRGAVVTLGLLCLGVSLSAAWTWDRVRPGMAHDDAAARAAGRHVAARSTPADTLFVWGNSPEIYYFADRVMATRFAWANYHTGKIWGSRFADDVADEGAEAHAVPAAWPLLLADLDAARPLYLVDAAAGRLEHYDRHPLPSYPALATALAHYHLEATVAGVPIYRRNDGPWQASGPSDGTADSHAEVSY
jgi:4-amino-4-deoxy-L-arabinose transferase-like glycosyltransferase